MALMRPMVPMEMCIRDSFLVLQRAQGVGVERLQRLNDTADSGFGFHGVTSRIILAKSIPHISQKIDRKSVGKREKICYDKSTGEMEVPPCAYSSSSAFFHGSTAVSYTHLEAARMVHSRAGSAGLRREQRRLRRPHQRRLSGLRLLQQRVHRLPARPCRADAKKRI